MSDQTVITEDQKAKEKEEVKEKSIGQEVREKTFTQLLQEQRNASKEQEEAATETKPTEEEEKKAKEIEEAKAHEEQEKKDKEAQEAKVREQEAIAKRTADELSTRQAAEKKAEEDRKVVEEAEKKRQEDLKPKFTGKDKDGNVVPSTYEEASLEGARIGKEQALEAFRKEQAEKEATTKAQQEEESKKQEAIEAGKKTFNDQLQKEIDEDLTDLWTGGKLTKMKDPKDPNDPGVKDRNALVQTAVEVNSKRIAEGKPLIRSLKIIYYEHYLPQRDKLLNPKPAGHDAPVMGNESTQTQTLPDDKYIPSRDRKKSFVQLAKEEAQRLAGKAKIR